MLSRTKELSTVLLSMRIIPRLGILLAIPIVILKQYEIDLLIIKHFFGETMPFGGWLGAVLLISVAYWLYKTARGNRTKD